MNNLKTISILAVIACALLGAHIYIPKTQEQVIAYTGDQFVIPHDCKHIALLGCTPHPTQYLADHGNDKEIMKDLHVRDFLDIEYVTDSFMRTLEICKKEGVDHLLIAYLPIYFVRMKPILGDQFVHYCRIYFNHIIPEMTLARPKGRGIEEA